MWPHRTPSGAANTPIGGSKYSVLQLYECLLEGFQGPWVCDAGSGGGGGLRYENLFTEGEAWKEAEKMVCIHRDVLCASALWLSHVWGTLAMIVVPLRLRKHLRRGAYSTDAA